jgi:hypothetical protein
LRIMDEGARDDFFFGWDRGGTPLREVLADNDGVTWFDDAALDPVPEDRSPAEGGTIVGDVI